jgi:hypothetical protein
MRPAQVSNRPMFTISRLIYRLRKDFQILTELRSI